MHGGVFMYSFQQEELEVLKGDYVHCLDRVTKYRLQLKKSSSFATYVYQQEMGIVNKVIFDLWDSILAMEKYLPPQKQDYSRRKLLKKPLKGGLTYSTDLKIAEDPEYYVCNKTIQKDLLQLLKKVLTKRQFVILYMYYFQNMKQREIASALHVSSPTVCEHINKAINSIRSSSIFLSHLNQLYLT